MIKVFVVEDDVDLNRFVCSSLRSAGYDVVSCFDGLQAIEKMDEEKCDLTYPIVPSYTFGKVNLDELISRTPDSYKKAMIEYDNIDPAIADERIEKAKKN